MSPSETESAKAGVFNTCCSPIINRIFLENFQPTSFGVINTTNVIKIKILQFVLDYSCFFFLTENRSCLKVPTLIKKPFVDQSIK